MSVALSGTATGGVDVNPASVDFGAQSLGALSTPTLDRTRRDATHVEAAVPVTGTNAAEFFVLSPSATAIGPANGATVAVGFQPTSVGPKSASFMVTSLDGGSRRIALSGDVACSTIAISGTAGWFRRGAGTESLTASGGKVRILHGRNRCAAGGSTLSRDGTVRVGDDAGTSRSRSGPPTSGCSGESSSVFSIVAAMLTVTPTLAFGRGRWGIAGDGVGDHYQPGGFPVTLVSPFTITGRGASQFSVGHPIPTLAAGAFTTVPLSFAPQSPAPLGQR